MQDSNIYKFYPSIGLQNINLKKLNDNFEALSKDIIYLKIKEQDTIASGSKGLIFVPHDLKLVGWVVGTYIPASLTIDIRKCTAQDYPNTSSITNNEKIVVNNSCYAEKSSLANWTNIVPENSWIEFFIESVTGTNRADIILKTIR